MNVRFQLRTLYNSTFVLNENIKELKKSILVPTLS